MYKNSFGKKEINKKLNICSTLICTDTLIMYAQSNSSIYKINVKF
jgi:hypothetical protein